jgi:hypothetical protein
VTRLSLLCLAGLTLALPVRAQSPQRSFENWATRPLALDLNVALAGPLGFIGASLDYAPVRYVSIAGGVGTNRQGLQLAGMCRVRALPLRTAALYVGAGYAQGPFEQGIGTRYGMLSAGFWALQEANHRNRPTPWHRWDTARWLNLELGGEERSARGFDARGFFGLATLLNPNANRVQTGAVVEQEPTPGVVPFVIYVGGAFGFSL